MKARKAAWLPILALVLACGARVRTVDTTVRIDSQPPGAFAQVAPSFAPGAAAAEALGKTPLLRYMPLPESGTSVQLTLRGYKPWTGALSPGASTIQATLEPLTDAEKQAAGWVTSAPIDRISVVPVRVGKWQIGGELQPNDPDFRPNFLASFEKVMTSRFGQRATVADRSSLESSTATMEALENAVKGIDMSQLAARTTPLVVDFPADVRTVVADLGGAVLLLRAEAHYLSGGARFARMAVPILLTAAGAAAGAAAANASGASFYMFAVFGPGPSQDTTLAQAFVVHSQTRELLWFGQAVAAAHYETEGITARVAQRLAEQVPAALLK